MARMNVAAFLESVPGDDALQQKLVDLAAQRGFAFSAEELVDAEPGAIAEPITWRQIARFPDLEALPPAGKADKMEKPATPLWKSRSSILTAANVVVTGSLAWYLWRSRRKAA